MKASCTNLLNSRFFAVACVLMMTMFVSSFANADVFIDNGDAGTSYTGIWRNSSGSNPYGSTSIYARPDASYTWAFSGQPAGEYDVLMWWTSYPNRGTAITVNINSDNGADTDTINQRASGGAWVSIGTFPFSGSGSVIINASTETMSDGRYVTTCADAVWFRQVSGENLPTIIDNGDTGTSSTGTWRISSGLNSYGTSSIYARPDATYTWQANSLPSGEYEVAMRWTTYSNRGTAIGVTVNANDGAHDTTVNQRENGSEWFVLGRYPFVDSGSVTITASTETMSDGRYVTTCADAVKFTYVGPISGSGTDDDGDGYTTDTDCNDIDPAVNPGATEVCDGVDNNCDGAVDEGFDADGDGFTICNGDCNDADAGINPGATDVCGDGIDQDCSGADLSCSAVDDVIIDNNESGTESTGTWQNSGGADYYGTVSLYARPQATYTWNFNPSVPGVYEVAMWWTEYSNRATDVGVTINAYDGAHDEVVNQQTSGGQWVIIGKYPFDDSGNVTIAASTQTMSDGRYATTCADAVRFRYVEELPVNTEPPIADFSVIQTAAATNIDLQFTDLSENYPDQWQWSFGDGATSNAKNPVHSYANTGKYTVSLTVSNGNGQDTETKVDYINIVDNVERIYILDGWGTTKPLFDMITEEVASMGGSEIGTSGVWSYTNPDNGVTYLLEERSSKSGATAAFKEEGSHIIYGGHSNYGSGMAFLSDPDTLRYFNDTMFLNTSTDMTAPDIPGMKYSQAYNNWNPVRRDGSSPIMPYDFSEGTPPYNFYLTYQMPGDPTHYLIEKPDGSYWERFPDSQTPAWYSPTGAKPDPDVDKEYFMTNPDPDYNRTDFEGNWSLIQTDPDGDFGYAGKNYHTSAPGVGNDKATWTIMVRNAGNYLVRATWQAVPENATNAVFIINHSGITEPTPTLVEVNQQVTDGYNELGEFYFEAGTNTIELTDLADGYVVADRISVRPLDNPEDLVWADFEADVVSGDSPLTVQFRDESQRSGDSINSWQWDFGDGNGSTEQDPQHTYTAPGLYTVTLTVQNSLGIESTEIKDEFIAVGDTQTLQANFRSNKAYGWTQTLVQFIDQSSGDITSWHWDFGDGWTSDEQNPQHAFRSVGVFTVTLTVTDASGSDTKVRTDYFYNMIGEIRIENDYHYKAHYYSTYRGRDVGKVVMDASLDAIPSEDLKYSRLFYNSCFTGKYYLGKFNQGVVFYTHSNSREPRPEALYVRLYMEGHTDEEIKAALNDLDYSGTDSFDLYGYYDFNKLPPSMR